jgi:proteic killer suppression protein
MIASFKNSETQELFETGKSRHFPLSIVEAAKRKLKFLAAADNLIDIGRLPGNCLESLKGNRKGQFSIRVNDQFRICFVWEKSQAHAAEIVDYH